MENEASPLSDHPGLKARDCKLGRASHSAQTLGFENTRPLRAGFPARDEGPHRLFFGAEVRAPWPDDYPSARMVPEATRHITLAFLGQNSFSRLQPLLPSAPHPSFLIGPSGISHGLLFLPPEKNRVVALSVQWLEEQKTLENYQSTLCKWLKQHGYLEDTRPFLPHITLARAPFDKKAWIEHFTPLPFFVQAIHLYQSLGNLHYQSLWETPLLPPFEELEHTADIAFLIRGTTIQQLHLHAQMALAFHFPPLIGFFISNLKNSLETMIIALNDLISAADVELGCPFKAVSFHGEIRSEQNILHWEMIVDV